MTPPTWPIAPDWAEPWRETTVWPTDVIAHAVGTERRRQLRSVPATRCAFRTLALDQAEAQSLAVLLEDNHTGEWLLPDWHTYTGAGTPPTSRTVRLAADLLAQLAIGREGAGSLSLAVEFEVHTAEGQT